ncbi:MAG: MATE family efflux transporter [Eubacteriales bacterium]|nr:MATE family efflux transporter [Eubacteriales bacterium]
MMWIDIRLCNFFEANEYAVKLLQRFAFGGKLICVNPFVRLYHPRYMVKKELVCGALPSLKEAYSTSFKISWPSAIEQVLVAAMGFIDTIMVSSMGELAINAVGITTQPKFLLMALLLSLNTGITAVVARRRGEKDYDGARRTLKQTLLICSALSALMTVCAIILAKPLLSLAGAEQSYVSDAVAYFRIVMIGQFFGCIGMAINAAQRGFGNTRIAMISNTAANLVNILFNFLLINGVWIFPRWGVVGAAVATALGSFVAFLMALFSVLKPRVNTDTPTLSLLGKGSWRADKRTTSSVVRVSSSAFAEQICLRFGFFAYVAIVARLGEIPYATHLICMNIIHISFSFADGFGIGATALVGRSLGEARPDLAMIYCKVGQRYSATIGLFLSLCFVLLRKQLIMLFSSDPAVIALGSIIVLFVALACLFQTSQVVLSGCLRGAGDSRYVAISSLISVGVFRPLISYILCYPLGLGLVGAWIGLCLDQFIRLAFSSMRMRGTKWLTIKL